tara:strand:- start:238 stop:414 length:177 start_codon:yes stop_codon:yes gene_type:complete
VRGVGRVGKIGGIGSSGDFLVVVVFVFLSAGSVDFVVLVLVFGVLVFGVVLVFSIMVV